MMTPFIVALRPLLTQIDLFIESDLKMKLQSNIFSFLQKKMWARKVLPWRSSFALSKSMRFLHEGTYPFEATQNGSHTVHIRFEIHGGSWTQLRGNSKLSSSHLCEAFSSVFSRRKGMSLDIANILCQSSNHMFEKRKESHPDNFNSSKTYAQRNVNIHFLVLKAATCPAVSWSDQQVPVSQTEHLRVTARPKKVCTCFFRLLRGVLLCCGLM